MNLKSCINFLKKLFDGVPGAEEAIDKLIQLSDEHELGQVPRGDDSGPTEQFPLPEVGTKDPNARPVFLFSDGACRGNPGPGSWGAMGQLDDGSLFFEANGVEVNTTNNRMELVGAIVALRKYKELLEELPEEPPLEAFVYSDSKYVVDGATSWSKNWKAKGWKKADGKPPENVELWKELNELVEELDPNFRWVKGHNNHPQNEHVDQLANMALDESGY